jgi:photosystem II stability/assembly factor-like uncharacterized protein
MEVTMNERLGLVLLALVGVAAAIGCDSSQPAAPDPDPDPDPKPEKPLEPGAWVRTGGPLGGLGYDIRMRPDNPDIMFVTDAWAGVFKSVDGGDTWFPSNTGITARIGNTNEAIPIFCLTIDPHDYDIVWAGTQFTRGIFKSIDGGNSWTKMDNGVTEFEGVSFRGITVDPRSSEIVYAAAEISSWALTGVPRIGLEFDMVQGVVYKTTDGGSNWTAIWRGSNLARYIWINPVDPDVLYLSTGIFDREASDSDSQGGLAGSGGVYKSTDGGSTWLPVNNGLGNLYVGSLYMHPEDPDILLAGTGNITYGAGSGVYLTTDGGGSWQHTLQNDQIEAVEFSESDPNLAYAGSAGAVYRSEDGGFTWVTASFDPGGGGWGPPGIRAGFPIDFQVDPRNPGRIFANNYGGGNFLSVDAGVTWTDASEGYTGAQVRDVVAVPSHPSRVFAAARSGLFSSTDGGTHWAGLNYGTAFGLEWNAVAVDPRNPQHVIASNNWGSVLLSSRNGGDSWQAVSQPAGEGRGYRAITFAPSDANVVYAGQSHYMSAGTFDEIGASGGVQKSSDGGDSWQGANGGVSQDANVTALAIHPTDPLVVYAATANHGVLKTTDGGNSWTALTLGSVQSPVALSVAVHPTNPDTVFSGLAQGGLHRSTDGGTTWRYAGTGLPAEATVSDIVFNPTNPDRLYIADRMSGVFRSTDGGDTWQSLNEGLRLRDISALSMSSDGRKLYAATEGEGVYRVDFQ